MRIIFALLIALVATGGALATAGTPNVEISVAVEREVVTIDADGKRIVERKPVTAARPGDVLVYTLQARNAVLPLAAKAGAFWGAIWPSVSSTTELAPNWSTTTPATNWGRNTETPQVIQAANARPSPRLTTRGAVFC